MLFLLYQVMKKIFSKGAVLLKNKRRIKLLLILGVILGYFLVNFIIFHIFKTVPDFAYYLFPKLEEPSTSQKILIISPHPDDEILSAGGYIQRAITNKAQIKIILLTDGDKMNLGKIRINQFKKATTFLGVNKSDLVLLNLPDGNLKKLPSEEIKQKILNSLKDFNPDIVIYPSFYDEHYDHKIAGEIIEEIFKNEPKVKKLTYLIHFKGYPQPRKLITKEFILPPYFLAFSCEWKVFDLTPQEIDNKNRALRIYSISTSIPIEKNFLFSFIRRNELFCEE